jgi:predicted Fe-Mo cluster-binding NifX family protein
MPLQVAMTGIGRTAPGIVTISHSAIKPYPISSRTFFQMACALPLRPSMNLAIPSLEGRVSPVFDVAQSVVLVELDGDEELRRQTVPLHSQDVARRAAELSQHGVHVLICGAISRPLEAMLHAAGIRVIPQTCGPVEDVLGAFVGGRLNDRVFLMPGCCGRRRRGWCGTGRGRRFQRGQGSRVRRGGRQPGSGGGGQRNR